MARLALLAAALLLAVLANAQIQVTSNYVALVGPDYVSRQILTQSMPRPIRSLTGINAVIQPITVSPPNCPGTNCSFTNTQLNSLGIVVFGSTVTGNVQLAVYSDNAGAPGTLLAQVTGTNLQGTVAANNIKINEVNFTTAISQPTISSPRQYWVSFLIPSGSTIDPVFFLDGTSCPNFAGNLTTFPASAPNSVFNIACDNSTVFLIFLGFQTTITYTQAQLLPLPITFYAGGTGANPTPTGRYTVQKCPKGGQCDTLASASERVFASSLLLVLCFILMQLLH